MLLIIKESPICKLNQGKRHAMISIDMLSSFLHQCKLLLASFPSFFLFFPPFHYAPKGLPIICCMSEWAITFRLSKIIPTIDDHHVSIYSENGCPISNMQNFIFPFIKEYNTPPPPPFILQLEIYSSKIIP